MWLLLVWLFFAACGEVKSGASNTTGNPVDEKQLKIGFNFEEIGAAAAYGTAEQKGAQLAVDEINAAGGSMENKSKLGQTVTSQNC